MHWPLASQFSAMLQRPQIAFRDPELKGYQIERDRFGQPRPWTGAFAVVYKGIPPHGGPPVAVRVFTTASAERHERYDAVSEYLRSRRVPCLVDFEYRDASVRAAGHAEWFPLILMEWVQGETLDRWVGARCGEGNREALAAAAARWLDLVAALEEAGVAHGDLQHANVMVTPGGELKLVDYDGMCVPSLVGRRNLEVGVKPYQHPDRNEQTLLSLTLDRFSAMVIYVALRALAADPGLWATYVAAPQYDKLLFRTDDFLTAEASPLVADLMRSPDPDVPDLVEQLVHMARSPVERLPPLAESAHPTLKRIEDLLRRQRWEEAVALLDRRGQFRDAPEHLQPLIQEAYRAVSRKAAWAAFTALPRTVGEEEDQALVKAWNESLFAGFPPAEEQRDRVREADTRLAIVRQIDALLRQSPGKLSLARESALVKAASALPEGYSRRLQGRIARARDRLLAMHALKTVMEAPEDLARREETIVEAWRKVAKLGCRNIVPQAWRRRIELAEKRAPLVRALRQIPDSLPADQLDRKLLGLWNEALLQGCAEAVPWLGHYDRAVRRQGLLRSLATAIRTRQDAEIVRLTEDPLLEDFPLGPEWRAAVQSARDRMAKTLDLLDAVQGMDANGLRERFDARLIRRHQELFSPHENKLRRWIERELVSPENLGLGPAVGRASLVCLDSLKGVFSVRWTWPSQRYCQKCLLAICAQSPGPGDEPEGFSVYHRVPIHCASWEAGGGSRTIHARPEWRDGWVAVWAMIDLGFLVLASHPLVLGRLGEAVQAHSKGRLDLRRLGWGG